MITEYFANPKPIQRWVQPAVYNNNSSYYTQHEKDQAMKRGITPHQFRQRSQEVTAEYIKCKFEVGDVVYPFNKKEHKKYGRVVVRAICKRYEDYGDVDWNDPPYILQVSPEGNMNETINSTVGWVTRDEPVVEGVC